MAEELADELTEAILAGRFGAGETIPTEPELAEQFGVSRSVVRDATRVLATRGLVDVQHGRGAFVTASPMAAFSDALRLALRREHATAWDVEEFFRVLWPEVIAAAARNALAADVTRIRTAAARYIQAVEQEVHRPEASPDRQDAPVDLPEPASQEFRDTLAAYLDAIFAATGNKVLLLLAPALRSIRSIRYWKDDPTGPDADVAVERASVMGVVDAIASGDPTRARAEAARWFALPEVAIEAMRNTAVGDTVAIPIGLAEYFHGHDPR